MDRFDLQELCKIRQKEAGALLRARHWNGVYYLAGYAVECALKACIAKQTKVYEFPDRQPANESYTHRLRELIRIAGLERALGERVRKDSEFQRNWDAVVEWSEASRYRSNHRPESARKLVEAISDKRRGIVSWIELYW